MVDEIKGLRSVDDIARIGGGLAADSAAALLVVEHAWAADLERAILGANGRLVTCERVPAEVAAAALADGCAPRAGRNEGSGRCSGYR